MRSRQLLTLLVLGAFVFVSIRQLRSSSGDAVKPTSGSQIGPPKKPIPQNGALHPIRELVEQAQREQEEVARRQSKTLQEAVLEYRRRYRLPPPPNFDKWFELAKARGVMLIDEYDSIYHSLLPFWGVPAEVLRQRTAEALGFDNFLVGLMIRDGKVVNKVKSDEWLTDNLMGMIKSFVQYLPDMDLAFNTHDEPRVVLNHDDLSRLVKTAMQVEMPKAFAYPSPHNVWTKPTDLSDGSRLPESRITRFNRFAHQPTWTNSRISCPPDSPSRNMDESTADDVESYACSPLHFVQNGTAFSDICNSPSLRSSFGFFDRPNSFDIVHDLFPIFSQSKVSSFQDILYPSPWYWDDKVPYKEKEDFSWEKKQNLLYWRGSTTGGFSRDGGWRRQHRQQIVQKINAHDQTEVYEHSNDTGGEKWQLKKEDKKNFADLFDVHFSHVGQCDPGDCNAQKEYFGLENAKPQDYAWNYKYLLDVDGNAFSGRFYAFLRSKSLVFKMAIFREWHAEWLRPWTHYIPLSLKTDEYFETLRYFDREEEGKALAERIANSGREWAGKVLRNDDLEVWFFRLLLEYGRLVDGFREGAGYSP